MFWKKWRNDKQESPKTTVVSANPELQAKLGLNPLVEQRTKSARPVYTFEVDRQRAVELWRALRISAPPIGYWPVIHGSDREVQNVYQVLSEGTDIDVPDDVLRKASQIDVTAFLQSRTNPEPELIASVHGEFPDEIEDEGGVYLVSDSAQQRNSGFNMGLIPVQESWQVFSVLANGGWNECPLPEQHVAIHRHWYEKYGAEIISVSGDIIESSVARLPESKEEALTLANDQFLYCEHIVTQGVQTVERLAAVLMKKREWFFWWD